MEEQNKTTESGQAAADLDRSLGRLDAAAQLDRLCTALEREFDLGALREYTVEAGRPDTITEDKLRVLRAHGVDRVSVNPQTMSDPVLETIGRRHSSAAASLRASVSAAHASSSARFLSFSAAFSSSFDASFSCANPFTASSTSGYCCCTTSHNTLPFTSPSTTHVASVRVPSAHLVVLILRRYSMRKPHAPPRALSPFR